MIEPLLSNHQLMPSREVLSQQIFFHRGLDDMYVWVWHGLTRRRFQEVKSDNLPLGGALPARLIIQHVIVSQLR